MAKPIKNLSQNIDFEREFSILKLSLVESVSHVLIDSVPNDCCSFTVTTKNIGVRCRIEFF